MTATAQWWADHACTAARDLMRLGQPVDFQLIDELERAAVQCGRDVQDALDGIHEGLATAQRSAAQVIPRQLRRAT